MSKIKLAVLALAVLAASLGPSLRLTRSEVGWVVRPAVTHACTIGSSGCGG